MVSSMIRVGLTSVADHPSLAANGKRSTFADYAQYFPVIELDTTFYGLKTADLVRRWQAQVPAGFQFIIKASRLMTKHAATQDLVAEFSRFNDMVAPLTATHQLHAVLCQFPPYFGVTAENVRYLQNMNQWLPDLPVAIEFRHPSWYLPAYRAATIDLLKAAGDIHVVVDEAQTVSGSVPLVPIATNPELTILRLHGRNQAWGQSGAKTTERTNYRYSQAELEAFALIVKHLKSKNVTVIFNNNGGHDAAANAQQFIDMLGLDFPGLAPRQLDLF